MNVVLARGVEGGGKPPSTDEAIARYNGRMTLRRTSHAVYDTQDHLVWRPKYQEGCSRKIICASGVLILSGRSPRSMSTTERKWMVAEDHVHLFPSFPPRCSIGEVVRTLKSISARELFRQYPSTKKRLRKGELWEDGYLARTGGDTVTSDMIEHIFATTGTRSNRRRSFVLSCTERCSAPWAG
jgi:putative transposase